MTPAAERNGELYSDNWERYQGEYWKREYDIKLNNGTIVENCYPNAGIFSSISDEHDQQGFGEDLISEIRFSESPRWLIDNPFSERKPDPEYVKKIDAQIEDTRQNYDGTLPNFGLFNMFHYADYDAEIRHFSKAYGATPRKIRGTRVPVRTEPKIGRNDPCTCMSGLKFKKCCGK